MPTVSTTTVRVDGVTLVEVCVEATQQHRVRLAVRTEGPVWPPRNTDESVTWDDRTVSVEVPSGASGVGFATPDPPEAVEVETVASEAVDGLPDGVEAWLERVEERVATAERLADADDLRSATAAVASVGGLPAVERLAADLARDRRLLARLSFAPEELGARAERVELPVASLSTVAQSRSS